MLCAYKVFLATALSQRDLIGTMNRFFACLALCASLSASAQDDNCTVLGIQDLTQMVNELKAEIDSLKGASMTRDSVADIAVGVVYRGELSGANMSVANLSGANLSGADLSGADLSYANLSDAELISSNLSNANLSNAILYSTILLEANLSGADLSGADLYGTNLRGANLSGADLGGANFFDATMTCLEGCPAILPSGYICEQQLGCLVSGDRYRIVPD